MGSEAESSGPAGSSGPTAGGHPDPTADNAKIQEPMLLNEHGPSGESGESGTSAPVSNVEIVTALASKHDVPCDCKSLDAPARCGCGEEGATGMQPAVMKPRKVCDCTAADPASDCGCKDQIQIVAATVSCDCKAANPAINCGCKSLSAPPAQAAEVMKPVKIVPRTKTSPCDCKAASPAPSCGCVATVGAAATVAAAASNERTPLDKLLADETKHALEDMTAIANRTSQAILTPTEIKPAVAQATLPVGVSAAKALPAKVPAAKVGMTVISTTDELSCDCMKPKQHSKCKCSADKNAVEVVEPNIVTQCDCNGDPVGAAASCGCQLPVTASVAATIVGGGAEGAKSLRFRAKVRTVLVKRGASGASGASGAAGSDVDTGCMKVKVVTAGSNSTEGKPCTDDEEGSSGASGAAKATKTGDVDPTPPVIVKALSGNNTKADPVESAAAKIVTSVKAAALESPCKLGQDCHTGVPAPGAASARFRAVRSSLVRVARGSASAKVVRTVESTTGQERAQAKQAAVSGSASSTTLLNKVSNSKAGGVVVIATAKASTTTEHTTMGTSSWSSPESTSAVHIIVHPTTMTTASLQPASVQPATRTPVLVASLAKCNCASTVEQGSHCGCAQSESHVAAAVVPVRTITLATVDKATTRTPVLVASLAKCDCAAAAEQGSHCGCAQSKSSVVAAVVPVRTVTVATVATVDKTACDCAKPKPASHCPCTVSVVASGAASASSILVDITLNVTGFGAAASSDDVLTSLKEAVASISQTRKSDVTAAVAEIPAAPKALRRRLLSAAPAGDELAKRDAEITSITDSKNFRLENNAEGDKSVVLDPFSEGAPLPAAKAPSTIWANIVFTFKAEGEDQAAQLVWRMRRHAESAEFVTLCTDKLMSHGVPLPSGFVVSVGAVQVRDAASGNTLSDFMVQYNLDLKTSDLSSTAAALAGTPLAQFARGQDLGTLQSHVTRILDAERRLHTTMDSLMGEIRRRATGAGATKGLSEREVKLAAAKAFAQAREQAALIRRRTDLEVNAAEAAARKVHAQALLYAMQKNATSVKTEQEDEARVKAKAEVEVARAQANSILSKAQEERSGRMAMAQATLEAEKRWGKARVAEAKTAILARLGKQRGEFKLSVSALQETAKVFNAQAARVLNRMLTHSDLVKGAFSEAVMGAINEIDTRTKAQEMTMREKEEEARVEIGNATQAKLKTIARLLEEGKSTVLQRTTEAEKILNATKLAAQMRLVARMESSKEELLSASKEAEARLAAKEALITQNTSVVETRLAASAASAQAKFRTEEAHEASVAVAEMKRIKHKAEVYKQQISQMRTIEAKEDTEATHIRAEATRVITESKQAAEQAAAQAKQEKLASGSRILSAQAKVNALGKEEVAVEGKLALEEKQEKIQLSSLRSALVNEKDKEQTERRVETEAINKQRGELRSKLEQMMEAEKTKELEAVARAQKEVAEDKTKEVVANREVAVENKKEEGLEKKLTVAKTAELVTENKIASSLKAARLGEGEVSKVLGKQLDGIKHREVEAGAAVTRESKRVEQEEADAKRLEVRAKDEIHIVREREHKVQAKIAEQDAEAKVVADKEIAEGKAKAAAVVEAGKVQQAKEIAKGKVEQDKEIAAGKAKEVSEIDEGKKRAEALQEEGLKVEQVKIKQGGDEERHEIQKANDVAAKKEKDAKVAGAAILAKADKTAVSIVSNAKASAAADEDLAGGKASEIVAKARLAVKEDKKAEANALADIEAVRRREGERVTEVAAKAAALKVDAKSRADNELEVASKYVHDRAEDTASKEKQLKVAEEALEATALRKDQEREAASRAVIQKADAKEREVKKEAEATSSKVATFASASMKALHEKEEVDKLSLAAEEKRVEAEEKVMVERAEQRRQHAKALGEKHIKEIHEHEVADEAHEKAVISADKTQAAHKEAELKKEDGLLSFNEARNVANAQGAMAAERKASTELIKAQESKVKSETAAELQNAESREVKAEHAAKHHIAALQAEEKKVNTDASQKESAIKAKIATTRTEEQFEVAEGLKDVTQAHVQEQAALAKEESIIDSDKKLTAAAIRVREQADAVSRQAEAAKKAAQQSAVGELSQSKTEIAQLTTIEAAAKKDGDVGAVVVSDNIVRLPEGAARIGLKAAAGGAAQAVTAPVVPVAPAAVAPSASDKCPVVKYTGKVGATLSSSEHQALMVQCYVVAGCEYEPNVKDVGPGTCTKDALNKHRGKGAEGDGRGAARTAAGIDFVPASGAVAGEDLNKEYDAYMRSLRAMK